MALLRYKSYEEYLDHFINVNDVRYMRNLKLSRKFIQNACGKSCMGRLLSRSQFAAHRRKMENNLRLRGVGESALFGKNYKGSDEILQEIAKREVQMLNKQLSTILFLMTRSQKGLEISGFIDLDQSLRESRLQSTHHYANWQAIFEGKQKLLPRPHDLSYIDWNTNKVSFNDTQNFIVVSEGAHSLLVRHRGDHKMICVNTACDCSNTQNAVRSIYRSKVYGQCVFFDHIIRRIM